MGKKSRKYEDWAEKHRPKSLKEMVGNERIISDFVRFAKNENFPNILTIGPAGVGKTTAVRLLAKAVDVPIMEINASLDSGISIVREDIVDYARQMDIGGAPYKVVILDQVDRLTTAAQQGSLQLMEEVSAYCKFLATTNDARGLHHAFASRYKVYKFDVIDSADMVKIMTRICRKERIKAKPEDLYLIANSSRGDLRQSIKTLQAACVGERVLSKENVQAWTWSPPYTKIHKSVRRAIKGDFTSAVKMANEILDDTQPKWFFMGLNDRLFKGKKFTDEERMIISLHMPEGNPHTLVDTDVFKFLALIARDFE